MSGAAMQPAASPEASSIAAQFVRARSHAQAISAFPGAIPTNSTDAYAVQAAAIELWPDRIAGWKVARIPHEWSSRFPETRLIGPVFGRNVYLARSGVIPNCPVFEGGLAAVETEIVIRARADAPADKLSWRIDEAVEYIDSVHMGVEVASSPLSTLNAAGPGAVISDFGNNWGVVVGEEIANWRGVLKIDCETFIDGQSVGAREVVMETGPLAAFAFTLGKCAARNRPLKAGAWISTGMITGVHDIRVGQRSRHVFTGFGEIGCRIVRAQPSE